MDIPYNKPRVKLTRGAILGDPVEMYQIRVSPNMIYLVASKKLAIKIVNVWGSQEMDRFEKYRLCDVLVKDQRLSY